MEISVRAVTQESASITPKTISQLRAVFAFFEIEKVRNQGLHIATLQIYVYFYMRKTFTIAMQAATMNKAIITTTAETGSSLRTISNSSGEKRADG